MKIKQLTVTGFRCYKNLQLNLHPQVTVLVADNGQGKTSILDAIRIGLWPFISGFDLAKSAYADPANTIRIADVLMKKTQNGMARQLPTEISLVGDYGQGELKWTRYRDSEAARSQTKDDKNTKAVKSYAEDLQNMARDLNDSAKALPVFGYYGTGRLWKEKRLTESKRGNKKLNNEDLKDNENIRTFAYRDALDPASSYKQFEAWFTSAFIKIREEQIKQIEAGRSSIKADPKIEDPVTVVQDAVNELLKDTGWQNISYSETHDKSLVLDHKDKGTLKADQLSDGIKNMLAMVADIAYRCALLNGQLGAQAAKESEGVVLIDEVDMHLHPKWQQTVIAGLTQAFPKIQFVVTTHSPQVLSTVPSDCIRRLEHGTDADTGELVSIATQPEIQSQGVASTDIMATILQVDPIPNIPQSRWLSEYKALIQQNQHETATAIDLKHRLDNHFGHDHPLMHECHRLIRLAKMKIKLAEKNNKDG